jgi:hypothetical protein
VDRTHIHPLIQWKQDVNRFKSAMSCEQTLGRPDEQHLERSEHKALLFAIVERVWSLAWPEKATVPEIGVSVGLLTQCVCVAVQPEAQTMESDSVVIAVIYLHVMNDIQ